ncbi:MAG TPA: nuclear transport factor 2 family protein [Acidimicrobiia bacterium]|nr:nuclear transport factor 2 family protein [Acidimicrobiia bacterium]
MPDARPDVATIADRVRGALESTDLTAFSDLLDPAVRWGAPDDPTPSCQDRRQVLDWYARGREAGVRARVTEVVAHGDKILVGLTVTGRLGAESNEGAVARWQVLTVAEGLIVDIRAFDDRRDATARVGTPG